MLTKRHRDGTYSLRLDYYDLRSIFTAASLYRRSAEGKYRPCLGDGGVEYARGWHYHQEDVIDDVLGELSGEKPEAREGRVNLIKMVREVEEKYAGRT